MHVPQGPVCRSIRPSLLSEFLGNVWTPTTLYTFEHDCMCVARMLAGHTLMLYHIVVCMSARAMRSYVFSDLQSPTLLYLFRRATG